MTGKVITLDGRGFRFVEKTISGRIHNIEITTSNFWALTSYTENVA